MPRFRVGALVGLLFFLTACPGTGTKPAERIPRGGTLRVGAVLGTGPLTAVDDYSNEALDPQLSWDYTMWELLRCCLTRTLLAHPGRSTEEGGARLVPDLAAAMPAVSADGKTWKFTLRPNVHYSPPLKHLVVRAQDFVRAFNREARAGSERYASFYSVIDGFDAYSEEKAGTIAGLETPDDRTLVIHLTKASGDFANRIALPAITPIPPLPSDPAAPFGIATGIEPGGHDPADWVQYGRRMVTTGPYMLAGTDDLQFSGDPRDRKPVSGYTRATETNAGKATLVRNPSWRRATDPFRGAYVDSIELKMLPDDRPAADEVGTAVDVLLLGGALSSEDVPAFKAAEQRGATLQAQQSDFARFVIMNPAVPPFDDVHVRRAANLAVDKSRAAEILGGGLVAKPAGHIILDSLLDNLLADYAPYIVPATEILARARAEMKLSRYDADKDGRCDHPSCKQIRAPFVDYAPRAPRLARAIADELRAIGLGVNPVLRDGNEFYSEDLIKSVHMPIGMFVSWGKDFMNASNFIEPLFSRPTADDDRVPSVWGATAQQLASWGYSVRSVPSFAERIATCLPQLGREQTRCWASLDQYLMQEIAPWIPLVFEQKIVLASSRIARFSFDQFPNQPALDQIAIKPETRPTPSAS